MSQFFASGSQSIGLKKIELKWNFVEEDSILCYLTH